VLFDSFKGRKPMFFTSSAKQIHTQHFFTGLDLLIQTSCLIVAAISITLATRLAFIEAASVVWFLYCVIATLSFEIFMKMRTIERRLMHSSPAYPVFWRYTRRKLYVMYYLKPYSYAVAWQRIIYVTCIMMVPLLFLSLAAAMISMAIASLIRATLFFSSGTVFVP